MLSKYSWMARVRFGAGIAAITACASLAVAASAAAAPALGTFQKRAPSPNPVNNVVVDPTTNLIYAQQYDGTGFYRYNPGTNKWKTLASASVSQLNNGGAAYLKGKIYTVYPEDSSDMGVFDIKTGTWTTIANPLGAGTADITAVGNRLYLAGCAAPRPALPRSSPITPPPTPQRRWPSLPLLSVRGAAWRHTKARSTVSKATVTSRLTLASMTSPPTSGSGCATGRTEWC